MGNSEPDFLNNLLRHIGPRRSYDKKKIILQASREGLQDGEEPGPVSGRALTTQDEDCRIHRRIFSARSSSSSNVLQDMQKVVTGRASIRFSSISSPHRSQIPKDPVSILSRA